MMPLVFFFFFFFFFFFCDILQQVTCFAKLELDFLLSLFQEFCKTDILILYFLISRRDFSSPKHH